MKALLCIVVSLMLAARAGADPNRYEWRTFGGVNVDLQPLFVWWAFVSHATNEPMVITQMDSNKLAVISNLWAHLPARPLPTWFRVMAPEQSIAVAGALWKVDATIEPAPMMLKQQTIYLQNPPVKEIEDFKRARAACTALQAAQSRDLATEYSLETNIQGEAVTFIRTNSAGVVSVPAVGLGTSTLQRDAVLASSNLTSAHSRTQQRDTQIAPLQKYLATFPDPNTYWLDHYAVRTGKVVDGLEVYDLGTAPGLTY